MALQRILFMSFAIWCYLDGPWSFRTLAVGPPRSEPRVEYNRDVRPLLSRYCFACHGPDKKKGNLRLDVRESATANGGIVPGDPVGSEVVRRVLASGHGQMPPASVGQVMAPAEVAVIQAWIRQGAPYATHWAYVAPKRPALPAVNDSAWLRNPVDCFVLARLDQEGQRPSAEASRSTLIRRVTLDLTGLPPTLAEVDAYLDDVRPGAYERVVDRLLASPRFGEHQARFWLDLARFGDTNGFRLDNHRDMWPWRDWVIRAYNGNMPFDQFTIEQLGGDLLPDATLEQRVATGFHRNTMVNFGNGSDPKDYLARAASDRVNTTAMVWLGSTMECASCHDHKYDPFTQKDYYRLFAYFNNVPEKGLDGDKGNPVPFLELPTPAQSAELARLRARRLSLTAGQAEYVRLQRAETELRARIPQTLVMEEMAVPRPTHLFLRGDYLQLGERVHPGVPASLPALPPGAPANRLGLARWLVADNNPLTARVTVNRIWQNLFGAGLVRTPEDFGNQGDWPTHPELLDWLAVEFRESGWDTKKLMRLLVTSAVYRQSSDLSEEMLKRDPRNELLARSSRVRLDGETIRDTLLSAGDLLDLTIGGPSVRPYQPPGLWERVSLTGQWQTYVPSTGRERLRRGVYTYWKRGLPHPALTTFDAPTRELCTVQRPRTNTPLQALVLLNDPCYLEAAGGLAHRVLRETVSDRVRLTLAFRLCTGRSPTAREQSVLESLLAEQIRHYGKDPTATRALLDSCGTAPDRVEPARLAAWIALGNVLLNLDETITRS